MYTPTQPPSGLSSKENLENRKCPEKKKNGEASLTKSWTKIMFTTTKKPIQFSLKKKNTTFSLLFCSKKNCIKNKWIPPEKKTDKPARVAIGGGVKAYGPALPPLQQNGKHRKEKEKPNQDFAHQNWAPPPHPLKKIKWSKGVPVSSFFLPLCFTFTSFIFAYAYLAPKQNSAVGGLKNGN